MSKKSFVIYKTWSKLFENLDNEKAGMLIKAICAHANGSDAEIEDETLQAVYSMIEEKLDEDSERYSEIVEKRKESANKKWMQKDANACKCIQEHYDTVTDTVTDTDLKEKVKKEKRTRFSPPTVDQVREYCLERNNKVDPEKFVNFYESKGWLVGKSPMKDWKAAVRNWEKDSKPIVTNRFSNFDERNYDMDSLEKELLSKSMVRGPDKAG